MRHIPRHFGVAQQRMLALFDGLEQAMQFRRKRLALNLIEMQYGGMCAKARPDGRCCMPGRPIDGSRKVAPIGLVADPCRTD